MFRPRVIPVLLLKDLGLVKTIKFMNPQYIGDPINAVKIFNDLKVDEIVFLDITATQQKRHIQLDFIRKVSDEANMPFAIGGGIKTIKEIRNILENGAEKVILNTTSVENPRFIKEAADVFGSSTIVACMDVKKNIFGKYQLVYKNAKKKAKDDPIEFAQKIEKYGVGEIIVQSVNRDGTYSGYDIEIIKKISKSVSVPVVALGGAADYNDFKEVVDTGFASAVAAGSLFLYHGPRRAVLINFPTQKYLKELFL